MARNNTGSERFYVSSWAEKVPDFKSTLVLIARNLTIIINSVLTRQCFYSSLKLWSIIYFLLLKEVSSLILHKVLYLSMKLKCSPYLCHRYLMAKDDAGKGVAFSHFRFDLEEGDEVLYW